MIIPNRFVEGAAVSTPAAGTLYTAPVNQNSLLKKVTFANSTNGALTLSVYLVAAAGAATDANVVRKLKTLAPYETYECYEAENHLLAPGDMLAAAASGAGIVAAISGLSIT